MNSRDGGGVALYINDTDAITSEVILTFSSGVIEALGVHIKPRNLVVIVVYRQPDDPIGGHRSGSKEFSTLLNNVNSVITNLNSPTPDIILCGDFNLPHFNWSSGTSRAGATREEQLMGQDINALANEHFMTQVIDESTH